MLVRILFVVVLVLLMFAPSLWARTVLSRNGRRRARLGQTGAELARGMLDRAGLTEVAIEETKPGADHYDPDKRVVRLSPEHHGERSLSAIVVAAHEVGHAIQHGENYQPLKLRGSLVKLGIWAQRLGVVLMLTLPLFALIFRSPKMGLIQLVLGVATMGLSAVIHLVTLPVEFDASFNRALPILNGGGLISPEESPAARSILKACALTYVAGALASMLNVGRWFALFRR